MAGVDGGYPDGFLVVVDAVPDTATAGDFVLPLGKLDAIDGGSGKATSQRMLTLAPIPWVCRDELPC